MYFAMPAARCAAATLEAFSHAAGRAARQLRLWAAEQTALTRVGDGRRDSAFLTAVIAA